MFGIKENWQIKVWALAIMCTLSIDALSQTSSFGWQFGNDSLGSVLQAPSLDYHSVFLPFSPNQQTEYETKKLVPDSSVILSLRPLLDLNAGINRSKKLASSGFLGAELILRQSNRLFVQVGYSANYLSGIQYLDSLSTIRNTYAGVGKSNVVGDGNLAHYGYGRANFQAGKRVNLEAGYGKHFWGDGFRSLILSDNAPAYPYAKFELDVWRIRYDALYAMVRQGDRNKFFVTHGFSINASKRFQFSFFEMVIWQEKDSLNKRTIDLHYLNPILFYRPVEYAQGSADNVLLGGGFKWRPYRKLNIYAQFVLDEFLLSAIRAKNGWWANKYGAQVGFKWMNIVKGLDWQSEINAVRPFTYSHGSPLQSWGNMYQPLAHPLGSNFVELVNIFDFSWKSWNIRNTNVYALKGNDTDVNGDGIVDNLGGDIFKSYDKPFMIYGNSTLQGEKSILHYNQFEVSKQFKKVTGLEYYVSHLIRYEKSSGAKLLDHYVMAGLRFTGQRRPNHAF